MNIRFIQHLTLIRALEDSETPENKQEVEESMTPEEVQRIEEEIEIIEGTLSNTQYGIEREAKEDATHFLSNAFSGETRIFEQSQDFQ